ncbi:MAG: ribonuclease D [Gammaproteobacteria bacterium]|jgi:ribonuclease D
MDDIQYIDTAAGARKLVETLTAAPFVAIDTEFVREKTYHPLPCLLQIAVEGHIFCVDLIALEGPDAVTGLLLDRSVTKVLHSARQDLELFYALTGEVPGPVYDTQIAAALLGFPDQCGYGRLVHDVLDIPLEKGHARTDWSRRPLSAEQLRYAADDVRYLVPLYQTLRKRLEERGRSEWPDADFVALEDPALYAPDPDSAWKKVKGWRQMDGPALARLQRLAAWREAVAVDRNRPRRWILADDALRAMAIRAPTDIEALKDLEVVPPAVLRRYAGALIERLAVSGGSAKPAPEVRLNRQETTLLGRLGKRVDQCARDSDVAPSLLATRAELKRMVCGDRNLPVLKGWRREMVGESLLAMLD